MGKWTNILVHFLQCLCHQGACLSQLQVSLACRWPWRHWWLCLRFHCIRQLIEQCILLEGTSWQGSSRLYRLNWAWRKLRDLLDSCTLGSFIPRLASDGVFQSPSGKRLDYLCNAFRGEASIFAEPMEDCNVLVCPFVPFGICSWGSQLHTAIIAVW